MEKKKICVVVAQPGAAKAFFKLPMEKLVSEFDIYLVANIKDEKDIEGLPLVGYKSINIERRPSIIKDIRALWSLYLYYKKEKFFAVHSIASKPSLLSSIAGAMAGVPHRLRTFTGQLWCNMTGAKRFFFKTIDRLTVALNTELLADGHPQARYLVEQKIIKPDKIHVLANGSMCGIDINRFSFDLSIREDVRSSLGIQDKVVYVFLGRLKKEKGIRELMAAFNSLVLQCPKAVLLLVGIDEENTHSWMADYSNLQENQNIIFYGFTPRPYDLLMAGDVFCMPSYREGFGLSVLEASCLGLPVICSDIYGMEDTMVDGVTGLRCKVCDVESLLACMSQLYDDKEKRVSLGKAGRERVIKEFSSELVCKAWYDYYMKLS
jgi:glycosyltransferase involved in cell wall biosynthesis